MGTNDRDDYAQRHATIGGLRMYVVRDATIWHGGIEEGDRYLNVDSLGSDWDALFRQVLNTPEPQTHIYSEDIDELDKSYRKKFQEVIPEYPML